MGVKMMEIRRSFAQYLMMVGDNDLAILEPLGYDVEISTAYVREHDEVSVNGSDLLDRSLAEILDNSHVNNRIETFYSFKRYCTGGQPIGVEMGYCQNR